MNESGAYANEIQKLKELLYASRHAVFFGGAGVSTDSGIPDFRGSSGIYTSGDTPEYLLSVECLYGEPKKFYDFYRGSMLYPDAKPNATHLALAELEKMGVLHAVVTQNIDGLHQAAGSENVFELHGTTARCYCDGCGKRFPGDAVLHDPIPPCDRCGGVVRPDVVLYGEGLDQKTWIGALREIDRADLLIVGGTSLVVNPAASLVGAFHGAHLVIINYTPTPYDPDAELVIRCSLSDVFRALLRDNDT